MGHSDLDPAVHERRPWNAGKNVGPKRPLRPRDIWAIRFFLDEHRRLRDRALFDIAIDSKLRGCDLVKLRVRTGLTAPPPGYLPRHRPREFPHGSGGIPALHRSVSGWWRAELRR